MESFNFPIPEIEFKDDFTIIYNGKDGIVPIKTSRKELLNRLHYFHKKVNEISKIDEYYIHDEFDTITFSNFINSIKTKTISLNVNNYLDLYKLSVKYEYEELHTIIENFIQTRPDLQAIISNDEKSSIDFAKEKIIAQNLDFFLQNESFLKLPINSIIRILNSPEKVLNNHHLLFNYIKKKIIECQTKNDTQMKEEISLLFGFLDFNEMSVEEIEEFVSFENFDSVFGPQHSNNLIKTFIESFSSLERRIEILEEAKKESEFVKSEMISKIFELEEKIDQLSLIHENHKDTEEKKNYIPFIPVENHDDIKMKKDDKSYSFKIVIVGDSGVGKTASCHQLVDKKFVNEFEPTICVEFKSYIAQTNGPHVKLQIWDAAGQERFQSVIKSYFTGAHGIILMFDLTMRSSFDNLELWLDHLKSFCPSNAVIILVGNKADLEDERKTPTVEAEMFALVHKLTYREISSKNFDDVKLVYDDLIQLMYNESS